MRSRIDSHWRPGHRAINSIEICLAAAACAAMACALLGSIPVIARSTTSRWCSFYGPKEFLRAQRAVADVDNSAQELALYWRDGVTTRLRLQRLGRWRDSAGNEWMGGENVLKLQPGAPDSGFKLTRQKDGAIIDCGGWPNSDT